MKASGAPGKVVLLSGASSGIGRATALRLAREGWRVYAGCRDPRKASSLRREAVGLPLETVPLDVDVPSSVRSAVRHVHTRAGRIDALINNAGWGAFGSVSEFTDGEIAAQFSTNVLGVARLTREVVPLMRRGGGGRILHVGSLAGRMTFAGIGLYCASKHAVEAMAESMRLELRLDGIEVTVLEPGHFRTSFKDNRRWARSFASGRSAHQQALSRVLAFGNRPKGPGPEVAARRIASILGSDRPPLRIPVGWDALLFPLGSWFLPEAVLDRAMDWMYRRFDPGGQSKGAPPPGKKVALVTGASSGLGLATALRLAREGYRVYAGYRNPRKLTVLRDSSRGLDVHPLLLDVDRSTSVHKAVRSLLAREGRLDALVNNAGYVQAGLWQDLDDREIEAQFQTNLFGVLRLCRETLPSLRASGGCVVNMGSVSGFYAVPLLGAYAASKFALRAVTGAIRMEEKAFGVRVCEVDPGLIRTSILSATKTPALFRKGRSVRPEVYPFFQGMIEGSMSRGGNPEEVAEKVFAAIESPAPPCHILVNRGSGIQRFFRWLVPDVVWEAMVVRNYPGMDFQRKPGGEGGG